MIKINHSHSCDYLLSSISVWFLSISWIVSISIEKYWNVKLCILKHEHYTAAVSAVTWRDKSCARNPSMAYNWTKSLRKTCQTLFKLIVHNWLKQLLYSHAFTPDFSFQNAAKWEWEYQLRLVPLINVDNLWTHQWCWKCTGKFAVTGSCKVKVEMWTSYNGNALKHCFFNLSTLLSIALWVIDFSWFLQISLVSFGCPWIITLLKSIHIPQYFVIYRFWSIWILILSIYRFAFRRSILIDL